MKRAAVLFLALLAGTAVLYIAWRQGEARQTFEYQSLSKEIPVPLLFDWMPGTAAKTSENRVRTRLGAVYLPKTPSRSYLRCIGYFRPADTTYYLLELDGVIYVEKENFVEPLIFALYNLYRGELGKPMPGTVADVVALLPDDFDTLTNLAARIPKQQVPEKGQPR